MLEMHVFYPLLCPAEGMSPVHCSQDTEILVFDVPMSLGFQAVEFETVRTGYTSS